MKIFFKGFGKGAGKASTTTLDGSLWSLEDKLITVRLDSLEPALRVGNAVRLESKDTGPSVLLVRAGEDMYRAFEDKCTHKGRRLKTVEGKPVIQCCSGHSAFDYEGCKLSGSALGPLKKYLVERRGSELVITL